MCHIEILAVDLEERLYFFYVYACNSDHLKSVLGVKIQPASLVQNNFIDNKCCSLCLCIIRDMYLRTGNPVSMRCTESVSFTN